METEINYKPKYKDVAATFKYGKNRSIFMLVLLTVLLILCASLVAMGVAYIAMEESTLIEMGILEVVDDGDDSSNDELIVAAVGLIIVGLCGIGFSAYGYYLYYKRRKEINQWLEDAVFVDGECWFDGDSFNSDGSTRVYFKFDYDGKTIVKKGTRRKNYKRNHTYYGARDGLLASFVASAITSYDEKNAYLSEMEKYEGKYVLLLYSPKYDELMIPRFERAKRKKQNETDDKTINVVYLSDNDFDYINQVLRKAGKSAVDLEYLKKISENEIRYIISLLTDEIGYDPKTDDIDDNGRIADAIIEKLLFILYDRQGSSTVDLKHESERQSTPSTSQTAQSSN